MKRALTGILLGLFLLLQYPLWLGKGSWLNVWDTQQQVVQQQRVNAKLTVRNAALDAEVRDLKQGLGAIEERARNELGMIRKNEIFFQVLDAPPPVAVAPQQIPVAEPTVSHGMPR